MVRRLCLITTAMLAFGSGLARADGDLGANAALKYWQAFATLPKLTDGEEKLVVREANTMPLDVRVQELVKSAAYSLRMLHVAAGVRPCDWSIVWKQEGPGTQLPQLSAARVLSALAVLRARISFDEGNAEAAVDDCVAALVLARQVSLDGSLIGLLTDYGIEARVGDALAAGLPKVDAKTLEALKKVLAALPSGSRPALAMVDAELNYVDWLANKVKAIGDTAELEKFVIEQGLVFGPKETHPAKAHALVEACGGTPAGFVQRLDEMRTAYATVAKLLDLPLGNAEKEIDLATKSLQANPVFEFTFPSAVASRQAQARTDVRRALLAAAVDIQLKGKSALSEHRDPVMGGRFEMTTFDGGFELSSTWVQKPAPITLTVGKRGN
jgi:hypothetical protein